jgi:hypothetical protein
VIRCCGRKRGANSFGGPHNGRAPATHTERKQWEQQHPDVDPCAVFDEDELRARKERIVADRECGKRLWRSFLRRLPRSVLRVPRDPTT